MHFWIQQKFSWQQVLDVQVQVLDVKVEVLSTSLTNVPR